MNLEEFDQLYPPRHPSPQWEAEMKRRPAGFMYWGPYDLFATWGMAQSRTMSHDEVARLEQRMTAKLGPEGEESGWAIMFASDKFAGRQRLHSLLCRLRDNDGLLHPAAKAVYLEERRYYRRHIGRRY